MLFRHLWKRLWIALIKYVLKAGSTICSVDRNKTVENISCRVFGGEFHAQKNRQVAGFLQLIVLAITRRRQPILSVYASRSFQADGYVLQIPDSDQPIPAR